jgi:hypothetical protein
LRCLPEIQEIKKQSETKTIYRHAYFPLGELLLLGALYKLTEIKKEKSLLQQYK